MDCLACDKQGISSNDLIFYYHILFSLMMQSIKQILFNMIGTSNAQDLIAVKDMWSVDA